MGGKKVGIRTGEIQKSVLKSGDFALVQWEAHWRFLDQEIDIYILISVLSF